MIEIQFTSSGPLLEGKADAVIDDALHQAELESAQRAYELIQVRLRLVLQHPTGHYQSRITVNRTSTSPVVTDGGVVYGTWLEGVSSRNHSTRFKGYGTFRKVAQQMDADAQQILETSVSHNIGRIE